MKTDLARRSSIVALMAAMLLLRPVLAQSPYQVALPGYHYSFPHDYFSHPAFQTEWWYYTGNLQSADGRRFGFELTFFRQAIDRDAAKNTTWDAQDLYLAHLALSDLTAGRFYHTERTNRSGPGIAGADEASRRIWNGNWQIALKDSDQQLQAIAENFELRLTLHSEKLPVIHGENGVSQKAEGPGRASHYISLTRLGTTGTIMLNGKVFDLSGLAWMDHEFFTQQLGSEQAGWDWLSVQLDDHTDLMLFHIRRKDGSIDPFSASTFIDAQGKATHLRKEDFILQPLGDTWKSTANGATYPISWKIEIAKLSLELEATTPLAAQELTGKTKLAPTYWEGAITLSGKRGARPLSGLGYLEMTGYDRAVTLE
ncbi:MAG TPA: lipocalin-like domain-containing protein [Candidatus Dormibacteraeota bacterium]|nr:lipocalin-like domain-containing protein [Candidatus Dormibacteraeota bacterium]